MSWCCSVHKKVISFDTSFAEQDQQTWMKRFICFIPHRLLSSLVENPPRLLLMVRFRTPCFAVDYQVRHWHDCPSTLSLSTCQLSLASSKDSKTICKKTFFHSLFGLWIHICLVLQSLCKLLKAPVNTLQRMSIGSAQPSKCGRLAFCFCALVDRLCIMVRILSR
jgi:hypothetical protein